LRELADKCLGRLEVSAIAGRDVGPLLGEAVADRCTDTSSAAGHERNAAVQTGDA
jgi:hypothetical protein